MHWLQKEEELAVGQQRNAELTNAISQLESQKDDLQSKLTYHLGSIMLQMRLDMSDRCL